MTPDLNQLAAEQMTDEQLRVEIAEFCGWTKESLNKVLWQDPTGYIRTQGPPRYPSDLNAMWEAEEKLSAGQWHRYVPNLITLCLTPSASSVLEKERDSRHATAHKRAVAFVKTIREIKQ